MNFDVLFVFVVFGLVAYFVDKYDPRVGFRVIVAVAAIWLVMETFGWHLPKIHGGADWP